MKNMLGLLGIWVKITPKSEKSPFWSQLGEFTPKSTSKQAFFPDIGPKNENCQKKLSIRL